MTRETYIDARSDAEAQLLKLLKQADLGVKRAYLNEGEAAGTAAAQELFERLGRAAQLFEEGTEG